MITQCNGCQHLGTESYCTNPPKPIGHICTLGWKTKNKPRGNIEDWLISLAGKDGIVVTPANCPINNKKNIMTLEQAAHFAFISAAFSSGHPVDEASKAWEIKSTQDKWIQNAKDYIAIVIENRWPSES